MKHSQRVSASANAHLVREVVRRDPEYVLAVQLHLVVDAFDGHERRAQCALHDAEWGELRTQAAASLDLRPWESDVIVIQNSTYKAELSATNKTR